MDRFQPTVTLGVSFQNKQDILLPSLEYSFLSLSQEYFSGRWPEIFVLYPAFKQAYNIGYWHLESQKHQGEHEPTEKLKGRIRFAV